MLFNNGSVRDEVGHEPRQGTERPQEILTKAGKRGGRARGLSEEEKS